MVRAYDGKARSNRRRATCQLSKRVTPDVMADFMKRADAAGYSDHQAYLTAFINGEIELDRAMKKDIVQSLGHIGKIGSNLNQIAKAVNEGRLAAFGPDELKIVRGAGIAVKQIGEEIRKALRK